MSQPSRIVGRYAIYDEIGRGGIAVVHFGRLRGHVGFSRTVAIKMLQPQFAKDPSFVSMFLDEARIVARVVHPNVVQTIDVEATQGELFVVMEYIHGESLARLMRTARAEKKPIPPDIAVSFLSGVLLGLHAAHEAKSTQGEPLEIVHRDVSPDNILIGVDGIAKVADFGVAKARGRLQTTRTGELKGKVSYMAPEQLEGNVTRTTDVFAAAIVLWEVLTGQRLFDGVDELERMQKLMGGVIDSPRVHAPEVPDALEAVVMRGLARNAGERFATALEMATALQKAVTPASGIEVAQWVETAAAAALERRFVQLARIEAPASKDPTAVRPVQNSAPDEESEVGDPTRPVPGLAADSRTANRESRTANRPTRKTGLWLVALLLAVAGLATVLLARREEDAERSPPSQSGERLLPEPPRADIPVDPSAAPAPPAPSATANAPALPARSKGKAHSTSPRAKDVKADCTPPYTIGSDGLRHYKPECW